MFVCNKGVDL